jgi:hypothetical protein
MNLQSLILAWACAPLTTCQAAAAIKQDVELMCQWLVTGKQRPLMVAA